MRARWLLLLVCVIVLGAVSGCWRHEPAQRAAVEAWHQQGTKAGEEITGPDGGKMVWVPAGEFMMGSRDGEPDERPVHRVRITRGFWLGKYPVTLGQWKEFGRTAVGVGTSDVWAAGRNYPVDGVLHGRASSYCDHYGMRLPTEAEWEYAARGSESRRYPWGNQWDPKKCRNRYNMGPKQDGFPVGHFSEGASWCGALDMVGSVEQWCGDWFGYDYYSESPRSDPPGPATGEFRVKRGTWGFEVPGCRAAFRGNYPGPIFDVLINTGGVRCAVTP